MYIKINSHNKIFHPSCQNNDQDYRTSDHHQYICHLYIGTHCKMNLAQHTTDHSSFFTQKLKLDR